MISNLDADESVRVLAVTLALSLFPPCLFLMLPPVLLDEELLIISQVRAAVEPLSAAFCAVLAAIKLWRIRAEVEFEPEVID